MSGHPSDQLRALYKVLAKRAAMLARHFREMSGDGALRFLDRPLPLVLANSRPTIQNSW